jgi:hypothetical protein
MEEPGAMPFIQVLNYTLTSAVTAGGSGPQNTSYIRMTPVPNVGAASAVDTAQFNYTMPATATSFPVGELTNRQLYGFFTAEEFDIHRTMLLTESPVFVEWVNDVANPPQFIQIMLRTGEEPPGEGPADTS